MLLWDDIYKSWEMYKKRKLLEQKAEEYRSGKKASEELDAQPTDLEVVIVPPSKEAKEGLKKDYDRLETGRLAFVHPEARKICENRQKLIRKYLGIKEKE